MTQLGRSSSSVLGFRRFQCWYPITSFSAFAVFRTTVPMAKHPLTGAGWVITQLIIRSYMYSRIQVRSTELTLYSKCYSDVPVWPKEYLINQNNTNLWTTASALSSWRHISVPYLRETRSFAQIIKQNNIIFGSYIYSIIVRYSLHITFWKGWKTTSLVTTLKKYWFFVFNP